MMVAAKGLIFEKSAWERDCWLHHRFQVFGAWKNVVLCPDLYGRHCMNCMLHVACLSCVLISEIFTATENMMQHDATWCHMKLDQNKYISLATLNNGSSIQRLVPTNFSSSWVPMPLTRRLTQPDVSKAEDADAGEAFESDCWGHEV